MMNQLGLYIGGQWLQGQGSELNSLNPINGDVVWKGITATAAQVSDAYSSAREAQGDWADLDLSERISIAEKFAELLEENQEQLARTMSEETGKPFWETKTEVTAMKGKVAISVKAQAERAGNSRNNNLSLNHNAHGVMAVFGPYNFPGHLPNGHIVPALLAGNTVLFKPSEETPLTAIKTAELWEKAGLPKGVLNLVQGKREVGEAICQQPIDGLLFTGSSQTGKLLHKQFGGRPEVLMALEMGGNNALIVDENVNIETAAQVAVRGAFLSAGQRCTCTRRLIVIESSQTDDSLKAITELSERLIVGKPFDEPAPFMGPVINTSAAKNILNAQAMLLELGGQELLKSKPLDSYGCLLSPAIIDLTGVNDVPDEEWFGPLLQVYRVKDLDEAIQLANQTQYGLAAGLVSDDETHIQKFKRKIRAGVVSVNAPTAGASSALPFGGIGASGNHRASAYYAADYCAWPQAITSGLPTSEQNEFSTTGIREN